MKEVILSVPLVIDGKETKSLSVRRSTVGDEEDAQALAVELGRPLVPLTSELCLFSALTGVSYDDLRSLPPYDYERLRAAYNEVNKPRPMQPGAGASGNATRNRRTQPQSEELPPAETDQTPQKS